MRQSIAEEQFVPAVELDSEVLALRRQFEDGSTLDQITEGAAGFFRVVFHGSAKCISDARRRPARFCSPCSLQTCSRSAETASR